ncbi:MAG: hypothetical protein ACTHJX_12475 [Terriglobales bacterium]
MLAAVLTAMVMLGLSLSLASAQTSSAIDTAYAAGYNAAYPLGQQDKDAGATANPRKFSVYQDGMQGYDSSYGAPETYRNRFQSGFYDGYQDGFAGRARALPESAAPAPVAPTAPVAPPAPEPGATLDSTAKANGYREGYNIGQSDANSNAVYNATASREFREARVGYSSALGDSTAYQSAFQSAFRQGYDDGFNHRLYDTAKGGRPLSNPLPTAADRLAARPSGAYTDGLLVAQGSVVQGRLDKELNTKDSYAGEAFTLTVTVPVWVGSTAAIPAGSTIQGTVQQVSRGGRLSGQAQLQLQYNTLTLPGQAPLSLRATTASVGDNSGTVNSDEGTVNGQSADTGKKAATGAAIGAVLGGIFGGGGGLLKGGAAGAAVGTAGVLLSHDRDLTRKARETVSVKLDQPLEIPNSGSH